MKYLYSALVLCISLTGCGEDGSDSGSGNGDVSDLPINSSGFPIVSGTYAMKTNAYNLNCSTGTSSKVAATSFNVNLSQNINEITVSTTSNEESPGITVYSESDPTGLIEKNGGFTLNSSMTGNLTGVSDLVASQSYSGTFGSSGYSGEGSINIIYTDLGGSCSGTYSFSASKLGAKSLSERYYESGSIADISAEIVKGL